ncbi:hypothetical protein AB28_3923 [Raoultella ornithinolytica 2-156-04_S1_C2]|nr:hypothetical protein AB00_3919 [Raoultella ornithinolytica 2-156-04_S1_C1]KDX12678.1 hypothetical protein AB28_3923 [Raoultella ornithinolytica 2-156-04_S1_C2]
MPIFIRRCQVFNTSAGEPVLEIVVKPGMSFLRWFARKGSSRQPPFTGIALPAIKQKKCWSPLSDQH